MNTKINTLFILLLILTSCGDSETGTQNEKEETHTEHEEILLDAEQEKLAGIELGKLEKRLMYDIVECVGIIDVPPTERASISAPIEGIIRDVKVIPGTKVRKGQLIAVLEHQNIIELQEKFLKSKSQLIFERQEFDRQKALFDNEVNPRKDFEKSRNHFDLAKVQFQSLKKQLQLIGISEESLERNGISTSISILSPITGFVSEVEVNLGMYVDANFTLFNIINDKHKHLELEVFSSDFDKIQEKQTVNFNIVDSEKQFVAEIHLINKEVHQDTKTVKIHGHLESRYPRLIIGTQVMAKILTNKSEVWTLPQEAVIREDNHHYIFVKEAEIYEKVDVEIGKKQDGYFEILNFKDVESKKSVVKGAYYLSGGDEGGGHNH